MQTVIPERELQHQQGHDPLRDGPSLLQSMWRHRLVLVTVAVLTAALGYGLSLLQPTVYQASGRLFLSDPTEAEVFSQDQRFDIELHTSKETQRILSVPVLNQAAELLGTNATAAQLRNRIELEAAADVGIVTVIGTAAQPQSAAELVNAVAQAYQQVVTESGGQDVERAVRRLEESKLELEARIQELRDELALSPDDLFLATQLETKVQELSTLDTRAEELAVEEALHGSGVELYEEAQPPREPAGPLPVRNALLTGVLGFAAAAAYAWWNAGRNRRAVSRDDPSAVLGVPLFGAIPRYRETSAGPSSAWTLSNTGPAASEAYQFVAASIEFALEDIGGKTVLITSAVAGEGKTVTTLNLAAAANRADRATGVVDGDIRARRVSAILGAPSHRGLTDLSATSVDACQLRLRTRISPSGNERLLPVIPAGTKLADEATFFRSTSFRKAMVQLKELAGIVLFDSAPLLAVSDTLAMASQVDAVVLIVARGTPMERLVEARRRLDMIGAPLIGYVFNRDSSRLAGEYGYYQTATKGKLRRRRSLRRPRARASA